MIGLEGEGTTLVVFAENSREDFERMRPFLQILRDAGFSAQILFVPVPESSQKELDFGFWARWALTGGRRGLFFFPFVRVADLPWAGAGTVDDLPVFFLRPSFFEGQDTPLAELTDFLTSTAERDPSGFHLRCDLFKTLPRENPAEEVWLSLRGGMELLQKIPFLFDYLGQKPGRWNEHTEMKWDQIQLKNELFEKEVTIRRLQRNERRYRKFFEDDITGDFLMDLNWRILDCNRAFARIFGFPSVDYALGYDTRQLFPSKGDLDKVAALFKPLNSLDYYELELVRPDGQAVSVIANLFGIKDDGRLVQVRGFLFDNTPRKNLERQLRESQKMEGLGRLAGGIAHDFNNLLTVINGYSELLLSESPVRNEELEEIHHAGLKAAELTRQLLAFSRQQVLTPQSLDLNFVVLRMENMLQRLMTERIRLVIETEKEEVVLKADKGQLEQVILNLVLNARDAMPQGGDLRLRTKRLVIETSIYDAGEFILPGTYVCLQVEDTGVGIEPEVQKKIFDPFFTTKTMGTGLGLAMVYGIVQQSGGYLRLSSVLGKGSVFSIYFEAASEETETSAGPPDLPPPQGTQERLILVEDEDSVRDYTRKILDRSGYQVKAFADGEEAFQFLQTAETAWDAVVSDIVMPQMTGPELSEKLREKGIDIPFLYMSGYTDDEIIRHGVSANQVRFIHKPFKAKELLIKVRQVLDVRKEP